MAIASTPNTLSSGDDYLLTARAEAEPCCLDIVKCHENRAFHSQSNTLAHRKTKSEVANELEVVKVSKGDAKLPQTKTHRCDTLPSSSGAHGGGHICCKHRHATSTHKTHSRNHATQTADSAPTTCKEHHKSRMSRCHNEGKVCRQEKSQNSKVKDLWNKLPAYRSYSSTEDNSGYCCNDPNHRYLQQIEQHIQENFCVHRKQATISSLNIADETQKSKNSTTRKQLQQQREHSLDVPTDGLTSTATSNFAYKATSDKRTVAGSTNSALVRRASFKSHTTAESGELSNDETECSDVMRLTPGRPCKECSEHGLKCAASRALHNECVRIKRKRFLITEDYCSSCSRCSSCSCLDQHTSSCSSLDDNAADEEEHSLRPQELTVAADCHRCGGNQASSTSHADPGVSALSRRSSASYCSCNAASYCPCSNKSIRGERDEDADKTEQMESFCTAADMTLRSGVDLDDQHSSTLTPLSNNRSSVDDIDRTMCSSPDAITDADASSLSQSAEYFSLASSAPQPTEVETANSKPKSTTEDEKQKEQQQRPVVSDSSSPLHSYL